MSLGDDLLSTTGRILAGAFKGAVVGALIGVAVGAAIIAAPAIGSLLTGAFTFGMAGHALALAFSSHAAVAGLLSPLAMGAAIGGIAIGVTNIIPGTKTLFGKSKKPTDEQCTSQGQQPSVQPAMQPSRQNADAVAYGNDANWQQNVNQSRQQSPAGRSA